MIGVRAATMVESRPDGSLVVVAETEPVRGRPSNELLQEVATVAAVLPPP